MMMNYRVYSLSAMALALFAVSVPALAANEVNEVNETKEEKTAKTATHVGKVVSITSSKLVMENKQGKKHSHKLTKKVILTQDGKVCKAKDLKAETKIRVTTQTKGVKLVTRIEAIVKNRSFVDTHDGEVVSITGTKLVMTVKGGKRHSHTLTEVVKFSCDGKVCKSSDLKRGMMIRVTSESDTPHTVTGIEAIDQNLTFASF